MATKRLPALPFLPQVPPQTVTPKYAGDLNLAINSLYKNLAQSVNEMVITATNSTQFPAAQGFKRFAFDGTKLYIDWNTNSWVPIGGTGLTESTRVIPDGAFPANLTIGGGPGIGFAAYVPFSVANQLNISSLDAFFSVQQATAVGSSQARFLTIRAGIYNQANPMLLLSSSSTSYGWTATGATFSGSSVKRAVLPWTNSLGAGNYVLGLWTSSSSSGNALAIAQSQLMINSPFAYTFGGDIASSTSQSSNQMVRFYGLQSVSSTALQGTVQGSDLRQTSANLYPFVYLRGVSTV